MTNYNHVAWHLIKNSLLRRILILTIGITLLFPLISVYFIFPKFVGYLTTNTEETALRVARHVHRKYSASFE